MKFPYRPIIWFDSSTNSFDHVLRSEIKLILHGSDESVVYSALVDSGSDDVVIPASIARYLGIPLTPVSRVGRAFGGATLDFLVGRVDLELRAAGQSIRWQTEVKFMEFPNEEDETLVLGHLGFLEYFTAIFDGENSELTLEPNRRLGEFVHAE